MAYNYTLLYILATLLSATFINASTDTATDPDPATVIDPAAEAEAETGGSNAVNNANENVAGIVSTRYIGTRKGENVFGSYVTPIDHCVTQQFDTKFRSQIFECEPLGEEKCAEQCSEYYVEGEVCPCRQVVKNIYGEENCQGPIVFKDTFDQGSVREYPFNCYEPEEIECELDEDGNVKVDESGNALCMLVPVDPNDYAPSLVELRITHAEMVETEITETVYENGTAVNVTSIEDVCEPQNVPYYKSVAISTELCVFGGIERNPNCVPNDDGCAPRIPYWHLAHCDADTFSIRKFRNSNCSEADDGEVKEGQWPFMRNNGCGPSKLMDKWWYTEVVNCTHPVAGLQAAAFRDFDHHFMVMIGIAIIAVFKFV